RRAVRPGMDPALPVRAGGYSAPPRPSASREALTMLPDTIADKRRSLPATRPELARIRFVKKSIYIPAFVMLLAASLRTVTAQAPTEYPLTADSERQPGVPSGEVTKHTWTRAADQQPRFNRSFEYDALGDRYARFLLEELLPEVGKSLNLTADPSLRAIGGASSGGICAFTVAWNRPDAFRRVLSFIGSYTGL